MESIEWIPVSEQLPEKIGYYIAYYTQDYNKEYSHVGVCSYSPITTGAEYKWRISCGFEVNVTHWMPLPEPPKD